MLKLQDLCVEYDATLMEALKAIDANAQGILFVQKNNIFQGTLTDGDIRRALISGADKQDVLGPHCNLNALSMHISSSDNDIIRSLHKSNINMIPLLNDDGIVVDFATKSSLGRYPVMEPLLNGKEKEYVIDCIDSNWISSQGAYVEKFETELSEICDVEFCISTSSGTTALHLALLALDIGVGDEVIVPNLTFGASVNSILHSGATPVLVDVASDDWNLCPQKIMDAITPNTKAIMAVHLYGNPCQMDKIMGIAKNHNLLVIEDCAEALGAKILDKPIGSFGDAAAFSFFANKIITSGEGGAVTFKESHYAEKAKILRDHGMSKNKRYWHEFVGYNYRMTNIQAAIGCAQLEQLEFFTTRREEIWSIYSRELMPSGYFLDQKVHVDSTPCRWLFTLLLNQKLSIHRDQLTEELRLLGIDTRPIFYPMSDMPAFQDKAKMSLKLESSEDISLRGLSFPSSVSLSENEIVSISRSTLEEIEKLISLNGI